MSSNYCKNFYDLNFFDCHSGTLTCHDGDVDPIPRTSCGLACCRKCDWDSDSSTLFHFDASLGNAYRIDLSSNRNFDLFDSKTAHF